MITRLVLVGLVAALGVTLPSGRDCDRYLGSAQIWVGGLLADWDRSETRQSEACVVTADLIVPPVDRASTRAIVRVADRAGALDSRTEPRTVASLTTAAMTAPAKVASPIPSSSMDEPAGAWGAIVDPLSISQALEPKMCRAAAFALDEVVSAPPEPSLPSLPPTVFAPADAPIAVVSHSIELPATVFAPADPAREVQMANLPELPRDVFADQPAQPGTLASNFDDLPTCVFAVVPRAPEPAAEVFETDLLCGEEVVFDDQIGETRPSASEQPEAAVATREWCVVATEPADDEWRADLVPEDATTDALLLSAADASMAGELADGETRATMAEGHGGSPPDLGQAVQLTHRALSAWMSVLTGPTSVRVTTR